MRLCVCRAYQGAGHFEAAPLAECRALFPSGTPHVVVPVANDGTEEYTRLARRGDTLLVLVPRVSHRMVDEKSACECDRGLVFIPRTYRAFVLNDVRVSKLERIAIPVTEDYIRWECKANLVHNETPRRNVAVASRGDQMSEKMTTSRELKNEFGSVR